MISLIAAALQEAVAAFERDDMEGYAHHAGKAGGVAATIGAYGIKAFAMCDSVISSAIAIFSRHSAGMPSTP